MNPSEQPLVSVCIPTYRRPKSTLRAVQSALDQTYKNIEVVCSDNHSDDDTFAVLMRTFGGDPRVKCISTGRNIGPVNNWRWAIENSRGEFAKLLFSDDFLLPTAIETYMKYRSELEDSAFIVSSIYHEHPDTHLRRPAFEFGATRFIEAEDFAYHHASHHMPLVSPGAAFFRRDDLLNSIIADLPGPHASYCNARGMGNDSMIFFRLLSEKPRFYFIREPQVVFSGSAAIEEQGFTAAVKDECLWNDCYRQPFRWFLKNANFNPAALKVIDTMCLLRDTKLTAIRDKQRRQILFFQLKTIALKLPFIMSSKPCRALAKRRIVEIWYRTVLKRSLYS